MKSVLRRAVAGGAVAATASAALLALAPTAGASGTPPYEPDPQKVGGITFYDSSGNVITSGHIGDQPMAAYAVGDTLPRAGDTKAVLLAAQPNASLGTSDWNVDQMSSFTSFPVASGPASITGLGASRPVVTGSAGDLSLAGFIQEFPNDPAHQSNAAYQNLYQLRLKTANAGGQQTDGYDVADVLVDTAAGTWTEVYPTNSTDTTPPSVTSISTPSTLTGPATLAFSETVTGLSAGAVGLGVTGGGAVATSIACLSGSTPVACSGSFDHVRLTPTHALVPGQHYTLSAAAGATHDLSGNPSTAASKAFRALTVLEESNAAVGQTWQKLANKSALGKSFVRDHVAGASASFAFTGSSVTWWTVKGPDQGLASLYVDGVRKLANVNNYAAKPAFKVGHTVKLANGRHTVRVLVLGKKSSKSHGTFVAVDAFSVGKTVVATPALSTAFGTIGSSRLFGGRAAVADLAGDTVTLTFRGTGVTLFTVRGPRQGEANVFVDGVRKLVINDYGKSTAFRVAHVIAKLADKQHVLKIVVLGKHAKPSKGNLITLDRVAVS